VQRRVTGRAIDATWWHHAYVINDILLTSIQLSSDILRSTILRSNILFDVRLTSIQHLSVTIHSHRRTVFFKLYVVLKTL
jgi:hypothetical protein